MRFRPLYAGALLAMAAACKEPPPPPVYQAVAVEPRDIIVSAQAAGTIQPDTVVEVKSKASGEVDAVLVETGQLVNKDELLVRIDPRIPRNTLAQARAELEVGQARLKTAEAQKQRADELYKSRAITEQEHEDALLAYANARAEVVRSRIAVENAEIQAADANVRAPITGTVIEKNIERGAIIASATGNVSGGTVLLKMADLSLVQVRTLVDETDIGKIQPGLAATVTVEAYPNRPFEGTVLKIEPQALTEQNVTMFPVLVRIDNREGLLRPGMNAEVEIHIGRREGVLAVPNAALRTQRDVASAAEVLGLDPATVDEQLAAARNASDSAARRLDDSTGGGRASLGGRAPGSDSAPPAGNTMTTPDGRTIQLPAGVTEAQVRAIFQKRMGGGELNAEERAVMAKMRQSMGGGRGGRGARGGGAQGSASGLTGGQYVVFVLRDGQPAAVPVRTGLTDLDYSEVVSGLTASDSVLVLPSASLVQSQQEFQERVNRMTGGGGVPGMRSQPAGGGGR
jgi:HlyD family secretion protein